MDKTSLLARLESAYSLNEGGADILGKRSGYFMIIRWPIKCFVYQWRNLRASMQTSNVVTSFLCFSALHIVLLEIHIQEIA